MDIHTLIPNILPFIALNILFALLYIVGDIAYTFWFKEKENPQIKIEMLRKSIHFSAAMLFIIATRYISEVLYIVLCIEAVIALYASSKLHIFHAANASRDRGSNLGVYFFCIGNILAALFFFNNISLIQIALLILGIADTAASLLGQIHPIREFTLILGKKSIAGSTSFFIITLTILYMTANKPFSIELFFLAGILTLAEALGSRGIDNLFIMVLMPLLYNATGLVNCLVFVILAIITCSYAQYRRYNKG